MNERLYDHLQIREIFHLEFLRWFSRKVKPRNFALKGGVNLRLFFHSFRYSEDMDMDAFEIELYLLQDAVMDILRSGSFRNALKPFGIEEVVAPDITKSKQTETTQRFKAHLITASGEDLFTKIEFSRRVGEGKTAAEAVPDSILREYKMAPLLIPHYTIETAVSQKISALSSRTVTQARDIFDLYILSSQYDPGTEKRKMRSGTSFMKDAQEKLYTIDFETFRDTVVSYLSASDRKTYNTREAWDEVRLRAAHFLEGLGG